MRTFLLVKNQMAYRNAHHKKLLLYFTVTQNNIKHILTKDNKKIYSDICYKACTKFVFTKVAYMKAVIWKHVKFVFQKNDEKSVKQHPWKRVSQTLSFEVGDSENIC